MTESLDNASSEQAPAEECNFEDSLAELEQVVRDLEDGNLGLSEALTRYEQGVKHLRQCYQMLEAAERRIELLTGVAEDGTPSTEAFAESSEPLEQSTGRRKRTAAKSAGANRTT